ncbi:hypothetical protein Ahy_A06g029487 isoform A [Arachis hypogaea]|uniref:Uncharacterized protein n=1 Tax=Arachis hypogaea TaxID=3818 RepID=A0A445CTK0_ARAHY|nr:hypothetical protein Ahy_A06g029487 isoform A [Arachis hypogaea]
MRDSNFYIKKKDRGLELEGRATNGVHGCRLGMTIAIQEAVETTPSFNHRKVQRRQTPSTIVVPSLLPQPPPNAVPIASRLFPRAPQPPPAQLHSTIMIASIIMCAAFKTTEKASQVYEIVVIGIMLITTWLVLVDEPATVKRIPTVTMEANWQSSDTEGLEKKLVL